VNGTKTGVKQFYFKTRKTNNYPKLCGNKRNCPADKVSIPETDVMSFLRSLFKRLPGRSLESLVTITGLHRVGLVRRITERKNT